MNTVEARDICKSFGQRTLWSNLSFSLGPGSLVTVSGQSGSGKTTLLNCLGALTRIDRGELLVKGINVSRLRHTAKKRFFRDEVSFLFQNYCLIESWSVESNLSIVRATTASIRQVLDRVGILDKARAPVYTLSGGEQQRVALARVILKPGRLVLADEPTAALDDDNACRLLDILGNLASLGACVVIATHDPRVLSRADARLSLSSSSEEERLLGVRTGRIVADGPESTLCNPEELPQTRLP